MSLARVRRALEREGLLLVTDPVLPSVAGIVAGKPVKGSWWSHPASHEIFAVVERLEDGDDALLVKLVAGKQTFVDEALWRDFFSVVTAKSPWQTRGLSAADKKLLGRVESEGEARAPKGKSDLETRLLVHGRNVHTESGAHAKILTTWTVCAKRLKFRFRARDPDAAKRPFEECVTRWHARYGKKVALPWQTR